MHPHYQLFDYPKFAADTFPDVKLTTLDTGVTIRLHAVIETWERVEFDRDARWAHFRVPGAPQHVFVQEFDSGFHAAFVAEPDISREPEAQVWIETPHAQARVLTNEHLYEYTLYQNGLTS